jgi:RimJ/RimL family protein N-acetyltransferase
MELTYRFAAKEDADIYFKWVNNPLVRANSFKQDPIRYEDHVKWFHARVDSPSSFLYLFLNSESQPVGQVRIDKGRETIIDISVDENFRGRSYSSEILKMACTDYISRSVGDVIFSYIKKTNTASYKSFIKCGFSETYAPSAGEYYKLYFTDKTRYRVISSFEKNGVVYDVKLMDNLDVEETTRYFDLFYKCFGKRPHLDLTWFDWFYNKNPYGACNNYALVDCAKNRFAGVYGLAKYRLVDRHQKYLCGVGVNGMIDDDYRNQGLYTELMRIIIRHKDENEVAVSYPHGLNKGSVLGHYKAGWTLLKKPEFYKTTDLQNVPAEKNVREIFSFADQEAINDLLTPAGYASYFEKTPEWLEWRFFSRPHKNYHVLGYFDDSKKIKGYVILGYYKGVVHRCQLLDYNALGNDVLKALINEAKRVATAQQCSELDLWLDDYSKELSLFREIGFGKTGEFYELLTFSKNEYNFDPGIKTVLADLDAV